ncbi:MAG: hypothetical protein GXP25_19265 [Planctomycetes bacterium]|nr:hypothetical protein [Planctomycetota bacterium]
MSQKSIRFRFISLVWLPVCFVIAFPGCTKPVPLRAGNKAEWNAFHYQKLDGASARNFNLKFTATGAKKDGNPHGRVVFNLQQPAETPSDYYFVDLRASGIEIGRVENGIEVHIGTRTQTGIGTGTPHKVVVKRRNASIAVLMDDTIVATAYDGTFMEGDVLLGAIGGSVAYEKPALQLIGSRYFTDDFMKAEEDKMGDWMPVSGKWDVTSLDNPAWSSNAFTLKREKGEKDGIIVASPFKRSFWDNYSCEAAVKPLGAAPVGLVFYYRDPENYYLFKWGARGSDFAKMQLIKKFHGHETVLAERKGGFTAGQWYSLRVRVFNAHVSAFVDDHAVLEVEDPNLCFGTVGLFSAAGKGASFDDVRVMDVQGYEDNFTEYSAGRWTELGGEWKVVSESGGQNSFAVNTEGGAAKAVSGEPHWRDYSYAVRIGPWAKGTAGICFYYQDELNYYAFKWTKGRRPQRSLVKVIEGKETVLHEDTPPEGGAGRYQVTAAIDNGHILLSVDGKPLFEDWDTDLDSGRIGLCAENTPSALFGEVKVTFTPEPSAMPTLHEAFSHESTMVDWASMKSDWQDTRNDTIDGQIFQTEWYRADFPGDVDFEIRYVPALAPDAQLRMLLAGDGADVLSGYSLVLHVDKVMKCDLWRQDKVVASGEIGPPGDIAGLRFQRKGRYVAGLIGRRLIVKYRDERPLPGQNLGYSTLKVGIKKKNVDIFSDDIYNCLFQRAISDWRVAAGTWEVSNRWQCDDRWSFFSGRSNRLAAIWNKKEMKGDITVECFLGPKMDQERGRRYEYVSDMNITICADGKDLTSGYSFIFGGWLNTRSRIMKGNKVLAERFKRIPSEMNIHRRWFHIKVKRQGTHLSFYVDNELILECDDPEPPKGGHVAIWTYNNGIMVSRVRISTTAGNKKESPFAQQPTSCKCVYDFRT